MNVQQLRAKTLVVLKALPTYLALGTLVLTLVATHVVPELPGDTAGQVAGVIATVVAVLAGTVKVIQKVTPAVEGSGSLLMPGDQE